MHLRLVTTDGKASTDVWTPRPFDLFVQPQRPGELCQDLRLVAPASVLTAVTDDAAAAGVPPGLWLTVAIEATRAVELAAEVLQVSRDLVVDQLNAASVHADGVAPVRTRLTDYAFALRSTKPSPPIRALGTLLARPSITALTAWSRSAEKAGVSLQEWALAAVQAAPRQALDWEVCSAEAGQTLAEWTLVQAARRRRSASSAAHPAA